MLKLIEIQDTTITIADAIASVLNMDVVVFDNDLKIIADSLKDWRFDGSTLSLHSAMIKMLTEGTPIILDNRSENDGCAECQSSATCQIKAFIAIPIKYNDAIIGGIEINATTGNDKKVLMEKKEDILNFISKMAELIISKLLEKETTNKLNIIREQLLSIMDSIDDGIMALDEKGYIVYQNSYIERIISLLSNNAENPNILDLLPQEYIIDLVKNGIQFRNTELNINNSQIILQTLVSGKPIKLKNRSIGAILTFKKMIDVFNVVNDMSLSNLNTSFDDLIGESQQIKAIKNKAKKIANSQSTILILGESGTGKEILARAIHESSTRKSRPFIAINCSAIPDTLLESELFGYEEGAFTGSKRGGKLGKFQLAEGGTIFLDEIGEMPIHLQPKLLRVLQEKTIEKVGGQKSLLIDVRIIAATNANLEEKVESGQFREDLFYRLNVIPISIPPLRERQGDTKILITHFLNLYNLKLQKSIKGFSSEVENILLNHYWKGNVRELQNVIEYAVNMENSLYICMDSIPQKIKHIKESSPNIINITTIDNMEKILIINALKFYGYDTVGKKLAAQALGISLATLYRKAKYLNN